jgi:hypothetical protein
MTRSALARTPNKPHKSVEYDRRSGDKLAVVSFAASECLRRARKRMEAIADMRQRIVGRRAGLKVS